MTYLIDVDSNFTPNLVKDLLDKATTDQVYLLTSQTKQELELKVGNALLNSISGYFTMHGQELYKGQERVYYCLYQVGPGYAQGYLEMMEGPLLKAVA